MIEQIFTISITAIITGLISYILASNYSNRKLKEFITRVEIKMNERMSKIENWKESHEESVKEKEQKIYDILELKLESINKSLEHYAKKIDFIFDKIPEMEKEAKSDRHEFANSMNESFALFRKEMKEDIKTWKNKE